MTVTCPEYRRWLSLDLDGELDPSRREALVRHLEECPACRAEKRLWLGIRDLLREEEVAVGGGIVLSAIEAVRLRRERARRSLPFVRRMAAAAALLLASLGALLLLGPGPAPPLAPRASDDLGRFLAHQEAGARALALTGDGAKVDGWGDGK